MGVSLEGASEEDISELDRLLTVMADMRHSEMATREEEREGEREGVRERGKEEVREKEKERGKEGVREEKKGDKPTWGTAIAGVSSNHYVTGVVSLTFLSVRVLKRGWG